MLSIGFGWLLFDGSMQQPTKGWLPRWRRRQRRDKNGRNVWGRTFTRRFGGLNRATKKLKYRERQGHQFGWLPLDGETQQPTKSRPQQLAIVRGDGAQGDNHGGKSCCSFLAINISGAKKEQIEICRDLGSRQSTIKHNNQPYQRRKRRDRDRRGSATTGECRGGNI